MTPAVDQPGIMNDAPTDSIEFKCFLYKLLVAGGSPEVVAQNGLRLALDFANVGDKVDAAFEPSGTLRWLRGS